MGATPEHRLIPKQIGGITGLSSTANALNACKKHLGNCEHRQLDCEKAKHSVAPERDASKTATLPDLPRTRKPGPTSRHTWWEMCSSIPSASSHLTKRGRVLEIGGDGFIDGDVARRLLSDSKATVFNLDKRARPATCLQLGRC